MIPLIAEFAGVGLALYMLGGVLMGLYAQRLFLRAVINRNFYMQRDNGDLVEQFAIIEESKKELRRTSTPRQVSPDILNKMQTIVTERSTNPQVSMLIRQLKHSTKGVTLRKEVGLVTDELSFFQKMQIGFCTAICRFKKSALCCCCGGCGKQAAMYNSIHNTGIQRIEHFLDVKTLIDSGINFKLLIRRLLTKQQRSLFKLQKARVIQVGNESDLGLEDQHVTSADSADLDGLRSRTITKTDLKDW